MNDSVHTSLLSIMAKEEANITDPLTKLFWTEQAKNLKRPGNGRRWHPCIIRLALLLHSQSPQAYRTIRETGVLALPGESSLRDYTNYIAPNQGFQPEVCHIPLYFIQCIHVICYFLIVI